MIRKANKFDLPELIEIMRQYAAESPMSALANPSAHDADHVERLLLSLIAGRGFVLLDALDRGMLAAVVMPNIWCPSVIEVREMAWWVHPGHRGGTVGGRLFIEFQRQAQALITLGRAHVVCASLIHDDLDLGKQGFRKLETTYCKE